MIAPAEKEKSLMSFNGDDTIGLYHNGIQIDVIGDVDTGKGATWGVNVTYKNGSNSSYHRMRLVGMGKFRSRCY